MFNLDDRFVKVLIVITCIFTISSFFKITVNDLNITSMRKSLLGAVSFAGGEVCDEESEVSDISVPDDENLFGDDEDVFTMTDCIESDDCADPDENLDEDSFVSVEIGDTTCTSHRARVFGNNNRNYPYRFHATFPAPYPAPPPNVITTIRNAGETDAALKARAELRTRDLPVNALGVPLTAAELASGQTGTRLEDWLNNKVASNCTDAASSGLTDRFPVPPCSDGCVDTGSINAGYDHLDTGFTSPVGLIPPVVFGVSRKNASGNYWTALSADGICTLKRICEAGTGL